MRKAFLTIALASLLVAGGVPVGAQTLPLRLLRDYVESLRLQAGIPGLSAALVGPEGVFWEGAFGRQDLARAIATRTDTAFHLDGLTQVFTATLVLRCVEEGRLSLDTPIARYKPDSPEPAATLRNVLMHTTGASINQSFAYRPERLEVLGHAVRECTNNSYRESLADLLDRLAMRDSVPGADITRLVPPAEGIPEPDQVERYTAALGRLATPYVVDAQRRAFPTQYSATTLTPATGLITSVLDIARFDQALRTGVLLRPETLAAVWTPAVAGDGRALPHNLGWFVQTYNGETLAWQFGAGADGSSSLIVTVPARSFTFVLLANSTGLFKTPPLTATELVASPLVRLFLGFSPA